MESQKSLTAKNDLLVLLPACRELLNTHASKGR